MMAHLPVMNVYNATSRCLPSTTSRTIPRFGSSRLCVMCVREDERRQGAAVQQGHELSSCPTHNSVQLCPCREVDEVCVE